jgi:hypothetical protein
MPFTAWLDEFGRPAWIALTVVSFLVAWPIGVLMLGILIGSRRMGCWSNSYNPDRWQRRMDRFQRGMESMQRGMEHMQAKAAQWQNRAYAPLGSSGNRAFDEYRAETLRRLEEEQRDFRDFLDRLRQAKDKAEFDQFMAERRNRPQPPTEVQY